MPGGRHAQAERDAITAETGHALSGAAFAAALPSGAVTGPGYAFDLRRGARGTPGATPPHWPPPCSPPGW